MRDFSLRDRAAAILRDLATAEEALEAIMRERRALWERDASMAAEMVRAADYAEGLRAEYEAVSARADVGPIPAVPGTDEPKIVGAPDEGRAPPKRRLVLPEGF